MDLSVVVLSWNTAELTLRALESIPDGAAKLRVERHCVDNGSTDGSADRVRRELPAVHVLETGANLGFARGNNRALPYVSGRYTCFLNSDCQARPGALSHVVRWLDDHPAYGIAAPLLLGADGRRQTACRPEPTTLALLHRYTALRYTPLGRRAARVFTEPLEGTSPREVDSVTGACLVIRTDVLRRLGGFDEGYPFYWEDMDLCRRARDTGTRVAWVPDGPAVVHEGGAATAVRGGPPRLAFLQGLVRYERKRRSRRDASLFALALVPGVVFRAFVEAPRLTLQAARRGVQGRVGAARGSLASARSWLALLERDLGALVRLLAPPR